MVPFFLIESLTLAQDCRFEIASVYSRSLRLLLQVQEDIHASFHSRTIDDVPVSLCLYLNKDSFDEMVLYGRSNNVFDEEKETRIPNLRNTGRFGVNTVLGVKCETQDNT